MKLRKQDWFRVGVSILGLAVLVFNTHDFTTTFMDGSEEPMYYYAVIGLYLAILGFAGGAVWEVWKYNQDV